MSLEKIYVVRHGFRAGWSVDPFTGTYSASVPSPTGIPVDPALTAHGVAQADELARHLMAVDPPVGAVYSSPYYRCLQTVRPLTQLSQSRGLPLPRGPAAAAIRAEYGLCEWFGAAPFAHPGPAPAATLRAHFPAWDDGYESVSRAPPARGETTAQLRRRVEATAAGVVARCDAEGRRSVLLCTHAAVVIMLGRVLTGRFPEADDADDFAAYTCGLSVYRRRRGEGAGEGAGVWDCEADSDCSFLSHGAERGWRFSGDEDFPGAESRSQHATHKL